VSSSNSKGQGFPVVSFEMVISILLGIASLFHLIESSIRTQCETFHFLSNLYSPRMMKAKRTLPSVKAGPRSQTKSVQTRRIKEEEKGRVYTKHKCPRKNCNLLAAPVHARPLFSSTESAEAELQRTWATIKKRADQKESSRGASDVSRRDSSQSCRHRHSSVHSTPPSARALLVSKGK
jgi:hypothetical protein